MSERSFTEAAAAMREAFDRAFAEPPMADREPAVDLLAIRVGATHLALRLEDVAEIATDRVIVPVPSDAATLLGLAGMRGVIVAVHHLGGLLGVATGDVGPRWLALCAAAPRTAVAFDELEAYVRVPPASMCSGAGGAVIARVGDANRQVVDVGALLRAIAPELADSDGRER